MAKRPISKGRSTRVQLIGGPLDRAFILMNDPQSGTLTINCKGQRGRYGSFLNGHLYWREKK